MLVSELEKNADSTIRTSSRMSSRLVWDSFKG